MTPRQRYLAARLAYIAIVLLATLADLDFSADLAAAAGRLVRAFTVVPAWRDVIDGLRNVALFAGLGAVWIVTSVSGRVREDVRRVAWVGLCLSASVEGLQLFSPERMASVLDLITNTLGALGGSLVILMLIALVVRARGARSYLGMPALLLAGAYVLATLCEAVTPLFRSELLSGLQGGPASRLQAALRGASLSWDAVPLFDVALFAPAAFVTVMLLSENGHEPVRTWRVVGLASVAVAFAAEVTHGLFGLSIRWEAAVTHVLALVFGAWAARRWLPSLSQALRGAARARAALVAYAALLVLWGWRPLLPQTDLSAIGAQLTLMRFVPLASLSERVDVFSALHVAQQGLLYLPLGSLLAVWPLRLTGRWSHLRPALWFASVIELGHLLIVDRYFDVTNALVAWAGLGIGWIVVRRSGFAPYGASLPPRAQS